MDDLDDLPNDPEALKLMQVKADSRNKNADSEYKRGLLRFEPWKVVAAVGGVLVALLVALAGLTGYQIGRRPAPTPAPIIINVPSSH